MFLYLTKNKTLNNNEKITNISISYQIKVEGWKKFQVFNK